MQNPVNQNVVGLLQSNNIISNTSDDCEYLKNSVKSWLLTVVYGQNSYDQGSDEDQSVAIQWAQILPIRCEWQLPHGVITNCKTAEFIDLFPACTEWKRTLPYNPDDASPEYYAKTLGLRTGELTQYIATTWAPASFNATYNSTSSYNLTNVDGQYEFTVRAIFNESETVQLVYVILLIFCFLFPRICLYFCIVLTF